MDLGSNSLIVSSAVKGNVNPSDNSGGLGLEGQSHSSGYWHVALTVVPMLFTISDSILFEV
jgi:hypothetical protein